MTLTTVPTPLEQHHDLALPGCTPEPLLSYLKGLGVLRLVATQADSTTRGYWRDDVFHLSSALDTLALERFFVDQYRPTPIMSPWNSAGGFNNEASAPARAVGAIAASIDPRLESYRVAIAVAKGIVRDVQSTLSEEKQSKPEILRRCRNELPDSALEWLDAAVVLTGERPRYPPLLGTGGNDGRLEFTVNYMQRLADLLPGALGGGPGRRRDARHGPAQWLRGALFGEPGVALIKAAVGQFNPGGAGGPNATAGFEADSLVNPWDLVLALSGSVANVGRFGGRMRHHYRWSTKHKGPYQKVPTYTAWPLRGGRLLRHGRRTALHSRDRRSHGGLPVHRHILGSRLCQCGQGRCREGPRRTVVTSVRAAGLGS